MAFQGYSRQQLRTISFHMEARKGSKAKDRCIIIIISSSSRWAGEQNRAEGWGISAQRSSSSRAVHSSHHRIRDLRVVRERDFGASLLMPWCKMHFILHQLVVQPAVA
jgi:hypothetical protein